MTTTNLDGKWTDPAHAKIAERAIALHDCANSISARLRTQNELIRRLHEELEEIRSIAEIPTAPVKAEPPAAEPPVAETPVAEPIAAEPAPVESVAWEPPAADTVIWEPPIAEPLASEPAPEIQTVISQPPVVEPPASASVPKARRSPALTYFCLLAAVFFIAYLGLAKRLASTKTETPKVAALSPIEGEGPDAEALALVRQWRMAGDDNTLFERLGSVIEHPGGWRAWSAEKTDEDAYLVIFREVAGTPIYAFEVDLKSRAVHPAPETVDRLTIMRVRDEATRKLSSLPDSN